ncbi:MAG: class I SAM-dependent methyltransferase, partial [Bacteroidia bacterium]|nr:class I SAM-dependent methyltransferase [Bacteroidia bacterium]
MITLPPPDRETLEKIYSSDYLYPVHLMALGEKKYRAKNFATFLKSQTPSHSKPKLLEAGCMYGYLLEDLSEIFDTEGIEISNDAVQHCQSTGLNVSNTSLENFLSIETGKYDIIILSHVFEHLVDPYACLEKMKNILRENGCIYLLVPNNRS